MGRLDRFLLCLLFHCLQSLTLQSNSNSTVWHNSWWQQPLLCSGDLLQARGQLWANEELIKLYCSSAICTARKKAAVMISQKANIAYMLISAAQLFWLQEAKRGQQPCWRLVQISEWGVSRRLSITRIILNWNHAKLLTKGTSIKTEQNNSWQQ